ncbi:molybdate ABC transporter substrate-binding protein [Corynebacterium uterequi]|uniref:Molybdenum ABC transporter, periplasmic molybdate-binding protein n=1 Tax=Corynebacterium uterequi TaxID=1072256 RepID=A0A0G3HDT2_9CORY|nr:molybdate ABC transporter substrate-binding protein [Corynebacterium uterequi]AKK10875.1 molybdenum ABC transporter, periplasmic molybdate-binding protein [Corynebacterium uterequi]
MVDRAIKAGAALSAAAVVLTGCGGAGDATGVTVFGASSTRVLNDRIVELAGGVDLVFNNDGSGALVSQLREGAPADLLITADTATMDRAVADGSVVDPVSVASNSMVIIVAEGNPAGVAGLADLEERSDLTVVACDPSVPCGVLARQLADQAGVQLNPASWEARVADVAGKVANGEADAGLVYRTDAVALSEVVDAVDIPGAKEYPTQVWAAVTTNAAHPEAAERVLAVLTSAELRDALTDAGFAPAV